MRIAKLVVFGCIAVYTVFFGIGDIKGVVDNYSTYNSLVEDKALLAKEYETAQTGEAEALVNMEGHFGKTAEDLKDKSACTDAILGIDGVKLVKATAYSILGSTEMELSTVEDAESIGSFDHTVNCIEYKLESKDLTKAVNGIKDLGMCTNTLTVNGDDGTLNVRVLFLNESGVNADD